MSRIPQPSRGTPRKQAASPIKPAAAAGNIRARTKSTPSKPLRKPFAEEDFIPDLPKSKQEESSKPLTIREAIALKRSQAKKVQSAAGSGPLDDFTSLEDAIPGPHPVPEEDDILGRPSLRETIERAKSTGSINLSSRSLQCIPSAVFDIHLGIKPDPLKSVPDEPPLPPAPETSRRRQPAWFEAHDLEVLKAWDNEISEIQHEISLFGSLKTVDFHRNKIIALPDQFADLTALTTLDLSHNALTSLPANIFSLPALSNLNIANNSLSSLPFSAPFSSAAARSPKSPSRGFFGAPEIIRASAPLPKLLVLNASNNKIVAIAIDMEVPKSIVTLDLSENPLDASGHKACSKLLTALAELQKLKTFRCDSADISDRAFEGISLSSKAFPSISILDFGSTKVTADAATQVLKGLSRELTFEITNKDPPAGVVRVIIGKKVIREAWELEAERRSKMRAGKTVDVGAEWEETPSSSANRTAVPQKPRSQAPVVKEAWEIEAEQGLLTEGGKRRARAAAAAAAAADSSLGLGPAPTQSSSASRASSLADPQYYAARTETLTLPASTAPKASGHSRAFSLAATSLVAAPARATDVTVPTATLPLSLIAAQPFAQTLKVLLLSNRRMDRSFTLPVLPVGEPLLPCLEELSLEGCNLSDSISVSVATADASALAIPSQTMPLLPLLTELFPSLRILNMAYNMLTSATLTTEILAALILASPGSATGRKGLKQLHLRGNRIADLDGFQGIALLFKGNREVPEWGLEELDLRDNEIGKLPAEMGLLPLDVFLVDGNVFRVPARRVWEREGTKGLLSWLRGRIE